MAALIFLVVLAALGVVYVGGTVWLLTRAWQRWTYLPLGAQFMAMAVAATATYGVVSTFIGLVKPTFAIGGEEADPSQKARILAEGISEAMNCFAFGFVIWLPTVFAYLILAKGTAKPPA